MVKLGRERGAVAVLVAIVLGTGVLMGMAALVIDVGGIYSERGQLQNGADAAALAIAGSCASPAGCGDVWQTARRYANANAKDGHSLVTAVCGTMVLQDCPASTNNLTACIGSPPAERYVEVRVRTELADGSTLLPPTFAGAMAGGSGRGTRVAACARSTARSVCVTAANETYQHTFNGAAGLATVTALRPLCPGERVPVTLVAYTAPDDSSVFPQYVYDQDVQAITSGTPKLNFRVQVPACYNQVDLAFRDGAISPLPDALYGDLKLGSSGAPGNRSDGPGGWYHGAGPICTPRPAVTLTATCDGTNVKLANGAGANVDAVFTITSGGTDRWVHVATGSSTVEPIAAGDVSILDNLGRTTAGHWTQPAGC